MIQPPIRVAALAILLTVNGCGGMSSSRSGLGTGTPGLSVAEAALQGGAGQVALQVSDSILRERPDDMAAREIKGDALTLLGQYDEATAVFQSVLAKNPTSLRANTGLGRIKLASDPAAAEILFQQILKRDARDQTALNNLGIARDLQGKHAEAQTAYRQVLAINPDLASAQVNMALSMAMSGQGAAAVQLLRPRALEAGASVKVKHDYAVVLAMAGQRAEAERVLGETMAPDEVRQALDHVTGGSTRTARGMAPNRGEISRVAEADLNARMPPDVVQRMPPDVVQRIPPDVVQRQTAARAVPVYGGQNGAMAVPLGGAIWTPGPAGQGIAPAAPPPMVVRPQGGGMMPDVDLAVTPTAGSVVPSALPAEAARVQEIRPVDQPRIQEGMPPSGIIPMQPGQAVRVPVAPARPPEVSSPVLNSLPPAVATDTLTRPMPPMAAPPAAMAPAMIAPSAMIAPVTAPPMAAPPVVEAPRPAASSERGTQNTPPRAEAVPPRPREETVDLRQRVMDARDRYDPTAAAPARNFSSGGPVIQFSAAPSEAAAHALWQNLTQKFPAVLGSREKIVVRVERNGAVFWRLRTDGFGSPGEARALCARLKASGQECIVPNS